MAEKILNTRILMKTATLEEWNASTLPLKKGEIAIATVAASAGTGLTEPVCMIKIGTDEEKIFSELPWSLHAKASDVLAACKSEAGLTAFVNNVIANSGLATDGAMTALTDRVTAAEGEIDALQAELNTAETGLKARMTAAEGDITALEGLVGEKAVATQISEAIAALKLDETYDAKGAAAQALEDAKSYVDGKDTAMNTRVEALEAIDHSHANAEELDKITAGSVAKWNAAEQNAKNYADGLDEVMDGRVAALEAKFGEGEGNVESQIEAAVNAEKERAMGVEGGLDTRLAAVEGDYLKSSDKTALQEQITANDGEIAALQGLVGDKSVADQVAAEAAIARAAEEKNAADIKAIADDYLVAADKTELQGNIDALANGAVKANTDAIAVLNGNSSVDGSVDKKIADAFNTFVTDVSNDQTVNTYKELIEYAATHGSEFTELVGEVDANAKAIETLNGDATVAGSVDKKIADAIAAENLGQYATDEELTALAGRVTTVEGKVETLEGEMDTAQADIAALEGLVGEKAVATQISEAIAAENLAQYAKAVDLEELDGRVEVVEGKVSTLEGKMSTAEGKISTLETEVAKKANDADLAAIAKTGNVNDLVQTSGDVLIFDCGGAE